jgi:translation initiation factor 4B
MSDAGSERASSRRGFDQGDGKVRDFGNWERKGPLSPAATAAPTMRESGRQRSNDDQQFRKQSPAWGERRSQDGSRPPRREFQDKPPIERAPTASEMDNQWRTKMRPDPPPQSPTHSREASNPPSPAAAPVPASRPKLNLQKRTVSEADPNKSASASATDAKASPFGAARPIDTFAREREIEEKRELAIRQKKEADDKAKTEKAEEKRLAKEREKEQAQAKGEKSGSAEQNGPKENGGENPQPGKSFEILRRATSEENGMAADEDAVGEAEETDTPAPTDDKAVKPKEIVKEIPSKANGEWRKGSAPETPTESTATALEDEGWSTVSTKPRNNRRGNSARQPIAS